MLSDRGLNPDLIRLSGFTEYWKLSRKDKRERMRDEGRRDSIRKGGVKTQFRNDELELIVVDSSNPEKKVTEDLIRAELAQRLENMDEKHVQVIDIVLEFLSDPLMDFPDLML